MTPINVSPIPISVSPIPISQRMEVYLLSRESILTLLDSVNASHFALLDSVSASSFEKTLSTMLLVAML